MAQNYTRCTLRGVQILVAKWERAEGRQVAFYEYPNSGRRDYHDLGYIQPTHTLDVVVFGETEEILIQRKEQLLQVLLDPSPATLLHPAYGEQIVKVGEWSISEDPNKESLLIEFQLELKVVQVDVPKFQEAQTPDYVEILIEDAVVATNASFSSQFPTVQTKSLSAQSLIKRLLKILQNVTLLVFQFRIRASGLGVSKRFNKSLVSGLNSFSSLSSVMQQTNEDLNEQESDPNALFNYYMAQTLYVAPVEAFAINRIFSRLKAELYEQYFRILALLEAMRAILLVEYQLLEDLQRDVARLRAAYENLIKTQTHSGPYEKSLRDAFDAMLAYLKNQEEFLLKTETVVLKKEESDSFISLADASYQTYGDEDEVLNTYVTNLKGLPRDPGLFRDVNFYYLD